MRVKYKNNRGYITNSGVKRQPSLLSQKEFLHNGLPFDNMMSILSDLDPLLESGEAPKPIVSNMLSEIGFMVQPFVYPDLYLIIAQDEVFPATQIAFTLSEHKGSKPSNMYALGHIDHHQYFILDMVRGNQHQLGSFDSMPQAAIAAARFVYNKHGQNQANP